MAEWSVYQRTVAADSQNDGGLYHYTDIGGLKGILDAQQLWGTHVAYLNDSQEFSYGVDSICTIIAEYADFMREHMRAKNAESRDPEEGEDDDFLPKIIMAVHERVQRAQEVLEDQHGPFVTCFSMYGDDLSQWRGYANGGFAIRFDTQNLKEHVTQVEGPHDDIKLDGAAVKPELHRVEYIPKKQSEVVQQIVQDHIVEIMEFAGKAPLSDIADVQRRLIADLIPVAAAMKHHAFVGEAEQRLIAHTSETFYTPSRIGLIPRVRFEFDPQAVTKVIVGPSAMAEVKRLSLKRYMNYKYPYAEVVPSTVPYREL